jgi:hypothetical protein
MSKRWWFVRGESVTSLFAASLFVSSSQSQKSMSNKEALARATSVVGRKESGFAHRDKE